MYLAYLRYSKDGIALYRLDAERKETRLIVDINKGDEAGVMKPSNPVWSFDGEQIAISSFENGQFVLYLANAKTGIHQQVAVKNPSFELLYTLSWY
jgi:Tol biopolymer transport system component